MERLSKLSPRERLGAPEDVAAAASFLVGPDGGWINGQIMRANGGFVCSALLAGVRRAGRFFRD